MAEERAVATADAGAEKKGILLPATREGLIAFLDLGKVIVPTYFVVALLDYSGVVAILHHGLAPAMTVFRLPGEAAVVLLTGWFFSLYAALGALKALDLPSSAVTGIGFMLLLCHAIPLEWAVLHKMGAKAAKVTLIRFIVSVLAGIAYGQLAGEPGPVASHPPAEIATHHFGPLMPFLVKTTLGCLKLLALVLAIIVPVTIISEWARVKGILPWVARRLSFLLGRLAPGEGILLPVLIGLIFGLLYGGGAMIALSRTGVVTPAEARTSGLFLGLCHSLLEDPLLFVAIGGSWLWLLAVRFLLAILLTPILRRWA